jgi:nucleotide-binding universal stress UspA family protein
MYKSILVPTDGSPLSEQAAAAAIEFARVCGAEIVALSVAEPYPPLPAAEGAMVIEPAIDADELQAAAQQKVDQVAKAALAAGVRCTPVTVVSLSPYEEIIDTASKHQCDLIFMASHGRRGLSRLLAGSVTQQVLAYSTIPVMVLRPGTHSHGTQAPGVQATAAT